MSEKTVTAMIMAKKVSCQDSGINKETIPRITTTSAPAGNMSKPQVVRDVGSPTRDLVFSNFELLLQFFIDAEQFSHEFFVNFVIPIAFAPFVFVEIKVAH